MKYTQQRNDGKTIVVQGIKWVSFESFPITDDLKLNGNGFFENLKSKEYFYYTNSDTSDSLNPVITNLHGPYLIDDLTIEDYIQINNSKAQEIFIETLNNSIFLDEQILSDEFHFEALSLFKIAVESCNKIYWLNKKFAVEDRFNSVFNYWAEFIVIGDNELKLITIGED